MKTKSFAMLLAIAFSVVNQSARGADAPLPASTAVRGVVKIEGPVPKSAHVSMAADPSCSKLHPGGVVTDDVIADAGGGLENVIVFVSQGLQGRAFDPPTQPAVIEQKGCMYVPHVVAMQANQKLEVVNSDNTMHNIHPMPANNREWNKAQPPGSPMEETFSREEIAIPVRCNVHPWMHSYIAVFKHPYFSVTGKGGTFELKNLPPGTYTVEAWHEKLGTATQTVTVGANQTKSVDFVFKGGH
jgi:hypothetical protein